MPYIDVQKDNILFPVYQRIGATGILKGTGKNVGWSNQTWLRVDEPLIFSELDGLGDIYPASKIENFEGDSLTLEYAIDLIGNISRQENIKFDGDIYKEAEKLYAKYGMGNFNINAPIKRGAFAVLVDAFLNPFKKEVDICGNFK